MRREDWPQRLAEYLEEHRSTPFVWGTFDCCLFVCDAIEAMTGVDPGRNLRGRYVNETGALDVLLEEYGTDNLERVVEKICELEGYPEMTPSFAQRGDVVIVNAPLSAESMFHVCLGIVAPGGRAAVASPRGFILFPLSRVVRAWRVG
jgi:cell wall-associated NlpC family hydrolase